MHFTIRTYDIPEWQPVGPGFGPNPMSRQKKLAAKQRKKLVKLRRKQGR